MSYDVPTILWRRPIVTLAELRGYPERGRGRSDVSQYGTPGVYRPPARYAALAAKLRAREVAARSSTVVPVCPGGSSYSRYPHAIAGDAVLSGDREEITFTPSDIWPRPPAAELKTTPPRGSREVIVISSDTVADPTLPEPEPYHVVNARKNVELIRAEVQKSFDRYDTYVERDLRKKLMRKMNRYLAQISAYERQNK